MKISHTDLTSFPIVRGCTRSHKVALYNQNQAWNFIFERARTFCKGHIHWKIFKTLGKFLKGTKAKTRGNKGHDLLDIPGLQNNKI